MNGVTDDYMDWMYSDGAGPNDDELVEDGPDCPFCGHSTEYSRGWITCDNCTVSWHGIEELQRDADALAAQGWAL